MPGAGIQPTLVSFLADATALFRFWTIGTTDDVLKPNWGPMPFRPTLEVTLLACELPNTNIIKY